MNDVGLQRAVLVVTSPDKLGRLFLSKAPVDERLIYVYDKSTNYKRAVKLLRNNRIRLGTLFKMFLAEFFRSNTPLENVPQYEVKTNSELQQLISKFEISDVYLFRAGLIISPHLLNQPVRFLNVHCARIPEFGGIGVIEKALTRNALSQEATLHRVVETIDSGEVVETEPYTLNPKISYRKNEDVAYGAGIKLLVRELNRLLS